MRWFLLVLLVLAGLVALGREVLALGEARRQNANPLPHFRRFRRRVKLAFLVLLLYVLAFFYDDFAAWGHFDPRASLVYFLGTILVLIWVLILSSRDARETALEGIAKRRELTSVALEELDAAHPTENTGEKR